MSLSDAGKVLKDHFRAGVCRMLIFESYPEIKEKVRLQIIFRLNSLYLQWNGYALKYRPQFHQLSILTTSKNLSEGSS